MQIIHRMSSRGKTQYLRHTNPLLRYQLSCPRLCSPVIATAALYTLIHSMFSIPPVFWYPRIWQAIRHNVMYRLSPTIVHLWSFLHPHNFPVTPCGKNMQQIHCSTCKCQLHESRDQTADNFCFYLTCDPNWSHQFCFPANFSESLNLFSKQTLKNEDLFGIITIG